MMVCIIMSIFTYEITTILSIIYAILIVAIKLLINKFFSEKNNVKMKKNEKMPVTSFYLAISNIFIVLIAILCE